MCLWPVWEHKCRVYPRMCSHLDTPAHASKTCWFDYQNSSVAESPPSAYWQILACIMSISLLSHDWHTDLLITMIFKDMKFFWRIPRFCFAGLILSPMLTLTFEAKQVPPPLFKISGEILKTICNHKSQDLQSCHKASFSKGIWAWHQSGATSDVHHSVKHWHSVWSTWREPGVWGRLQNLEC